jgi:hypothetical protein
MSFVLAHTSSHPQKDVKVLYRFTLFREKFYLLPPFSSFLGTSKYPNHGNTIYLMYCRHGLPPATFGGQKALLSLSLKLA